jgi:hypothetical protein
VPLGSPSVGVCLPSSLVPTPMTLTLESIEQKIRARVNVMDQLIYKRDWSGVSELALECQELELAAMRLEAEQRASLPRGKHGCDD